MVPQTNVKKIRIITLPRCTLKLPFFGFESTVTGAAFGYFFECRFEGGAGCVVWVEYFAFFA